MDMDFGYDGGENNNDVAPNTQDGETNEVTDLGDGKVKDISFGDGVDPLDDDESDGKDTKNKDTKDGDPSDDNADDNDNKNNTDATDLVEGSVIAIGDDEYTVDASGNVVDKDGNIFKEAKDVKEWVASFDNVEGDNDDKSSITVSTLQETLGIEITDDNDQPVQYDNSPEGISAYINDVLEVQKAEQQEIALNTLFEKYPIVNDVLNYYVANGNSLEGFGEIQDRTNIVIEDSNEAQQESIIRTAWKEQGRKGDVDGYISWLKSSGTLLDVSKEELAGLQEADKQTREELAAKAAEEEEAKVKETKKYWDSVYETIDKKEIAGYKIPDTIIINKNGQKISATPKDFFNYIYQVDSKGKSTYQNELAKETPESRKNDELLRAYLKFTGGNYSNLVDMAVNKEKVNKLRLTAKERTTNSVRITKPKTAPKKGAETDFGY